MPTLTTIGYWNLSMNSSTSWAGGLFLWMSSCKISPVSWKGYHHSPESSFMTYHIRRGGGFWEKWGRRERGRTLAVIATASGSGLLRMADNNTAYSKGNVTRQCHKVRKNERNSIAWYVCVWWGGVAVHLHCCCLVPWGAGGEDEGRNNRLDQCMWSV